VIFGNIPRDPIPLNNTRFVAFDLETTGVAMHKDRIVEIALVAWKKGSKKETFSTLVNPGVPVSQRSTDIHGLTNTLLRNAPFFVSIKNQIKDFIMDSVLIGFNVLSLDLSMLNKEIRLSGEPPFYNYIIDVFSVSNRVFNPIHEKSLAGVAKKLDIASQGNHRALPDAETTMKIWIKILEKMERLGIHTLNEMFERGYFKTKLDEKAQQIFLLGRQQRFVEIIYDSPFSHRTRRIIEPLGVRGSKLDAFCHLRADFRSFNTRYILEFK